MHGRRSGLVPKASRRLFPPPLWEGDYPGLDLLGLCSLLAAVFLIGIVMSQAAFGILSNHAATLVHPAIIGEVRGSESVVVASCTPINELLISGFDKLDS